MELTLLLVATAKLRLRKMTVIRLICYPGSLCTRKIFRFTMCSIIKTLQYYFKRCKFNWLFGTLFLLTSRENNSVIFNKFHQKLDLTNIILCIFHFKSSSRIFVICSGGILQQPPIHRKPIFFHSSTNS